VDATSHQITRIFGKTNADEHFARFVPRKNDPFRSETRVAMVVVGLSQAGGHVAEAQTTNILREQVLCHLMLWNHPPPTIEGPYFRLPRCVREFFLLFEFPLIILQNGETFSKILFGKPSHVQFVSELLATEYNGDVSLPTADKKTTALHSEEEHIGWLRLHKTHLHSLTSLKPMSEILTQSPRIPPYPPQNPIASPSDSRSSPGDQKKRADSTNQMLTNLRITHCALPCTDQRLPRGIVCSRYVLRVAIIISTLIEYSNVLRLKTYYDVTCSVTL